MGAVATAIAGGDATEAAARGDFSGLFGSAQGEPPNLYAYGMFLAVTCGESFPLMDYAKASEAARQTVAS